MSSDLFQTLTDELILAVLSFFIGRVVDWVGVVMVDERALQSARQVSRRFSKAVNSRCLWSRVGSRALCGGIWTWRAESGWPAQSLVGLRKLDGLPDAQEVGAHYLYRVEELASSRILYLAIHLQGQPITRKAFRSFFLGHLLLADNFLSAQQDRPGPRIPAGLFSWEGALVWWYPEAAAGSEMHRFDWAGLDEYGRIEPYHDKGTAYTTSSLATLLALETKHPQPGSDGLTPHIWASLVDWVVEIVEVFDLDFSASFRALNYFDYFLQAVANPMRRDAYQLVVGCCLYLAALLGPSLFPAHNLLLSADNAYDLGSFMDGILDTFNSCHRILARPVVLDFVNEYGRLLQLEVDSDPMWIMRYISELSLQAGVTRVYESSRLAAGVVVMSLYCFENVDLWPDELSSGSGYQWEDLAACLLQLSRQIEELRANSIELDAIPRRYSEPLPGGGWTDLSPLDHFIRSNLNLPE